ncbi:hypothetical protein DFAR_2870031 [Desulfarculales bacterium]
MIGPLGRSLRAGPVKAMAPTHLSAPLWSQGGFVRQRFRLNPSRVRLGRAR